MPEDRERMQELGAPAPRPSEGPQDALPPNSGLWAVPYYQQFSALYNTMSRVFQYYFDDALLDSRLNALVMRNDYVIRHAISRRIRPVVQLDWQLEAVDQSNPRLVENASKLTRILQGVGGVGLQQLKRWLMEAVFFGRSAVQVKPKWDYSFNGQRELVIADWEPVHCDSIVIRYDGWPGIMVNPVEYRGETTVTQTGLAHFLTPNEDQLFVMHKFEPEAVDFFRPEQALAAHGLGYRGTLYWLWWLREALTQVLLDFAQKLATGITIFYYEQSNEESLAAVTNAAKNQIGNLVYLFPRNRSRESAYSGSGIERIEVSPSGANFLTEIWQLTNEMMTFAILGESGTTEAVNTGLGGSVGDQHGITADERVKYDANDLEVPMQKIVNLLNAWNCPGDPPPKYKHLVDKRNPGEFMEAVQFAYEMGLDIDENQVRDELGLPKPQPGSPVLSKIQAMQPSAVSQVPQGVPMAAPTGPGAAVGGESAQPDQSQVVQGQPVSQQAQPVGQQGGPSPMQAEYATAFARSKLSDVVDRVQARKLREAIAILTAKVARLEQAGRAASTAERRRSRNSAPGGAPNIFTNSGGKNVLDLGRNGITTHESR